MRDCTAVRQDLGAYVLEGLDAEEAAALEAHLEGCAGCRAEHHELAGARSLLDLARDAPPRVPHRVRDRVVAEAARRRGRRRWAAAVAVAAAVAALVGGVVGWQLAPAPVPDVAVPLEDVEPFEASGWATFRAEDDLLVVELELDGLDPLPEPSVYEAWLATDDERIVSIGQFVDTDDAAASEFLAHGTIENYQGFWITAEPDGRDPAHEGPTVLRAYVPPPR